MRKSVLLFAVFFVLHYFSVAQDAISYQAIARNAAGQVLASQNVAVKFVIHQSSITGTSVFTETHAATTNPFGLFTLAIGSVNTTQFQAIDWATGPFFMEVLLDPSGGTSFTSIGNQQLLSVPYALYAKKSGNASPTPTISINAPNTVTSAAGSYSINVPAATTYSAGTGINITGGVISNTATATTPTITGAGSATVTSSGNTFTVNAPAALSYSAGQDIAITSGSIINTAPDKTVTITPAGSATVTGTYPNFTINTPTALSYSAGQNIAITSGSIINTAPDKTVTITPAGSATVTGTYPNFTINTPAVTTYSAGTGINIAGGVITNTAAAITPTITGQGSATVTSSGNTFTVNAASGTLLPNGKNGQILFSNGTNWDTIPRIKFYYDGFHFGIGTLNPLSDFHVYGGGRFDASVVTNTVYTNDIEILGGTAGKVLTSDALSFGHWVTPATALLTYTPASNQLSVTHGTAVSTVTLTNVGTVNGSGTPGLMPVWSATNTLSNSSVASHLVTGGVTINPAVGGTGSPAQSLLVHGPASGSTYVAHFLYIHTANTGIGISTQPLGGHAIGTLDNQDLGLFTNNTNVVGNYPLVLKAGTGRIGIGNTSPAYLLDVNGGINSASFYNMNGLGTPPPVSNSAEGRLYYNSTLNKMMISENAGAWVPLTSAVWTKTGSVIYNTTLTDKVGIGTMSPGSSLEVVTDGSLLGSARITSTVAATVGPGIFFDGFAKDWTITGTNNNAGSGPNKLVFRDYTLAQDRMVIDGAGNVGIGTTNPANILDVLSNTAVSTLRAKNTGAGNGIEGTTSSASSAAIIGYNEGTGSSIVGLKSATATSGSAGRFENMNGANTSDALVSITPGDGAAIHAVNTATATTSSNLAVLTEDGHLKAHFTAPITSANVSMGANSLGTTSITTNNSVDQSNDVRGVITFHGTYSFVTGNSLSTYATLPFKKKYKNPPVIVLTPSFPPGLTDNVIVTAQLINVSLTDFTFKISINYTEVGITLNVTQFDVHYIIME